MERKQRGLREGYDIGERNLPTFGNQYNNGVLMENWYENRIYDASGRKFTLSMDHPVGLSQSIYKTDYVQHAKMPQHTMMRPRGLGKKLMFGGGTAASFDGIPTSSAYGEDQRDFINSKYTKNDCSTTLGKHQLSSKTREETLTSTYSKQDVHNMLYDKLHEKFTTTKKAMDLPVACYTFQREANIYKK